MSQLDKSLVIVIRITDWLELGIVLRIIIAVVLLEVHPFSVVAYGNVAKAMAFILQRVKAMVSVPIFQGSFATNIFLINDEKIKLP